jgi:hypothetical protein
MVNNAVTAIRGQADSLRQKPQDTATLQQLEAISTAAKRASGFTRQLLLLGGQYRLQRELVDLNQVLQSQYWKLKGVLRDQVELREFLSPTLPAVIADTRLLEHIAVNLVVLIGGSIPGAGSVIITTRPIRIGREHARRARGGRTGNFVCLSFGSGADCVGSRLPAGVADQTTSANLRLASVEAAVEELFGWTELSTNASSGSEVRVYLPSVRVSRKTAFACGTTEPVCA